MFRMFACQWRDTSKSLHNEPCHMRKFISDVIKSNQIKLNLINCILFVLFIDLVLHIKTKQTATAAPSVYFLSILNLDWGHQLYVLFTFSIISSVLFSLLEHSELWKPTLVHELKCFRFRLMDWHAEIGHQGEQPRLFRPTAFNFPNQSSVRCPPSVFVFFTLQN